MQRAQLCVALALAVFLLPTLTKLSAAQVATGIYRGHIAAEGEVLVKFRQIPLASPAGIARTYDLSLSQPLGGVRALYRLRSRSKKIAELVSLLSARADVVYAEPNFELHTIEFPDDPQFVDQWALQNTGQSSDGFSAGTADADISAVPAWDISTGGTTHVVGIVDTGIDYTHPDLKTNIWSAPNSFTISLNGAAVNCPAGSHGFNAITATCDPMDDYMHGTHVSGIIGAAGNNNLGVVGVNWATSMMGLKFLNSQGSGYVSDAVTAIEFAIQVKSFFASTAAADVRILSNSWGGGGFSQALQDEIDEAASNDILFVAAAGNSASNNDTVPTYPASLNRPNMIAVAATDNNDALAYFSNYGQNSVELGAPGVAILSTLPGGNYGYLSGTSMATPYVSGAAALMLSICSLATPDLKKNLLDNVDLIPSLAGQTVTGGRLNVNRAIRSCSGPVGLSPLSVSFGTVLVGKTSNAKVVTLTNYQTSILNLSSIVTSGDFAQTNNCGNSLAAKAACTITVTLTPSSANTENGQLQVFDDAANSPQAAALTGTGALDIDLVASTSIAAQPAAPGGVITVTSTVLNQGTMDAGASVAGIYLSQTGLKDISAVAIGSFNVPALSAGSSFPAQTSATVPASVAVGSYYVLTCADNTNLVVESNETNNCGVAPTALQVQMPPLPDLIERSLSFVPINLQTIQISDTAANLGTANAATSVTQYYFSATNVKDASAQLLNGQRLIPALSAAASSQGTATAGVPQNMPPGIYYVLACADDTNIVQESNETNNCTAALARIQFLPDLVESGVSSQTTVTGAGATITVRDTAGNQGGGSAVASVTQYYLSTFTNKANTARLLSGNRTVPALASGGNSIGGTDVTIPQDMVAGSYYLLACADDTNLVPETNENNNCGASSSKIQMGPDLVESAVSSQSLVSGAGATIAVSDTASNQGGGNAAASSTQYYLSAFTSKTANARLLTGNRSVPVLASGGSSTGGASATIPQDMATGNYYLLACADDTNFVPETNENNNCGASSSKIQVGPDLVESAVSSQTLATGAGATIAVSDTAGNQGGGNAAVSVTQYYLSPLTNKVNTARLLSGNRAVPALASSGSSIGGTNVTIPPDMATGTYYLLACADDTNLVAETNENNNCAASSARIQVGPDLVESAVSSQSSLVSPGGNITVSDTASNQGGGNAVASFTQYYLSAFTTKTANARLLAGNRPVPPLPSGGSSAGGAIVTIPQDMVAGSYYLLACADDTNLVIETNENNNCAAFTTHIRVSQ